MLDSLGARVQQEHSKIAISLSSKDDELSQVKLQLADTIGRHSTDVSSQSICISLSPVCTLVCGWLEINLKSCVVCKTMINVAYIRQAREIR